MQWQAVIAGTFNGEIITFAGRKVVQIKHDDGVLMVDHWGRYTVTRYSVLDCIRHRPPVTRIKHEPDFTTKTLDDLHRVLELCIR